MRDSLRPLVVGKNLMNIAVLSGRYQRHPETWQMNIPFPIGVRNIITSGKLLAWDLRREGGQESEYLLCRVAMTGKWETDPAAKHNHLRFDFTDAPPVFFNDARNFGTVRLASSTEYNQVVESLGFDILTYDLTPDKLNLPKNQRQSIGKLMLDQSVFNGIGNYLRSEILYAAEIFPTRAISSLTEEEWTLLCQKTTEITRLSYFLGGATIATYKNLNGERGRFQERFNVYGRKQDPEGRPVIRQIDDSGRAIWYVPEVQQ